MMKRLTSLLAVAFVTTLALLCTSGCKTFDHGTVSQAPRLPETPGQ